MGDYSDFCEEFGGSASDPDFMDQWIETYLCTESIPESKGNFQLNKSNQNYHNYLPKGKLIHMVKLTGSSPAKPIGIIWNIYLKKTLFFTKANELKGIKNDDPARWFIDLNFTVRSRNENGYWYQVIFQDSDEKTRLSKEKKQKYELIAFN